MIANSLSITIAQRTREFATLRTLGASRRQVLGSILARVVRDGRARLARSGSSSGSGSPSGLFKLFDAVGFTLPNTGLVLSQTRTVVVALAGRHPRHAGRQPPPRVPGDARAADRRRPRGRDAAAGPFPRFRTRRLGAARDRSASRALIYGLFGSGLTDDADPRLHGARDAADLLRGRDSSRRARPRRSPPCSAGPATRIGGAPGALARDNAQRNPQRTASTACGADDRARARHARRRARRRDHAAPSAARSTSSGSPTTRSPRENNFYPIPIAAGKARREDAGRDTTSPTSGRATRASSTR